MSDKECQAELIWLWNQTKLLYWVALSCINMALEHFVWNTVYDTLNMSNCVKLMLHYMLITWLLLFLLTGAMPNGFLRQVCKLGCYLASSVNEFFVSETQKRKNAMCLASVLYMTRQKQTLIIVYVFRTTVFIIKILLYPGNSSGFSVSAVPPRSWGWDGGSLRLTWLPCPVAAGLSLLGDLTSIGTVEMNTEFTLSLNYLLHVCLSEVF